MSQMQQTVLAGLALVVLGTLGFALVCHAVPQNNGQLLATIIGAISGALVVGGAVASARRPDKPDTPPAPLDPSKNP